MLDDCKRLKIDTKVPKKKDEPKVETTEKGKHKKVKPDPPNLILENEIKFRKLPFNPEVPHFNGFISSTFTDIGKPSKKLHDYAVTRAVNKYVRRYPELEEFTPLSRYLEPRREFAVDPHTVMPRRVIQEFIVTRV